MSSPRISRYLLVIAVAALLTALLLSVQGCAGLPSFDLCEEVRYERTRELIKVECKPRPAAISLPSVPGL